MQNTTFAKRSLAIVLGLAASGFAMQACSSDTVTGGTTTGETTSTGTEGTGGTGGRDSTATTTTTSTATTTTGSTSSAGGAGGGGVGGAGGAGGGTSTGSSSASSSSASSSSASSSSASSSSASSSSASSSSASSTSASSSTGGPGACTELTAAAFAKLSSDGDIATYAAGTMPNLGAAAADSLQIEFYGSGAGAGLDGENKGTFNLANGIDNNYSTCARCVRVFEDPNTGRIFFQQSGTLVVDATSDQLNGKISATLTNLTLVEVTIASGTYVSTPVPNGACLHVASATIAVTPPVVPATWACNPAYYGDAACDCGCGVIDIDCPNALASSCEYCDDIGSCSASDCTGGEISPNNNSTCVP